MTPSRSRHWKSEFWGLEYFTEVPWWKQGLNALGHVLLGGAAAFALLLGLTFVALDPSASWRWAEGATIGGVLLALRELVQFVRNRKPHILDRLRDTAEGAAGGALGALILWML